VSEPHFVILVDSVFFSGDLEKFAKIGFSFSDSLTVVVAAHASLDEYVANWFGLDQSKYQWALNDYYEATGKVSALRFLLCNSMAHFPFNFGWEFRLIRVVSFDLRELVL